MTRGSFFRLLVVLLVLALLIAAVIVLLPRVTYICSNCGSLKFGSGYSANLLSDVMSTVTGKEEKVLCEECAILEHGLALATGMMLDDYKLPLILFGEVIE